MRNAPRLWARGYGSGRGSWDLGHKVYERDREAAGTLLGSAPALRFFLFLVPATLTLLGVAGLLGRQTDANSISSTAGVTGSMAHEIDSAFEHGTVTPWLALGLGLIGMASSGRSLTRALAIACAVCRHQSARQRTPIRSVGIVVGVVVGMSLITTVVNRIRESAGLAIGSVSRYRPTSIEGTSVRERGEVLDGCLEALLESDAAQGR